MKKKRLKLEEYEKAAKLREEEKNLEKALNTSGSAERPVVDIGHIQEIIEKKTGIPVGKLHEDEHLKMKP